MSFIKQNYDEKSYYIHIIDTYIPADKNYEVSFYLRDEDGNTTIVEFVKPYLFPLSSMTEEQEKECQKIKYSYYYDDDAFVLFDWYDKNHFDYRGLIEKGLALEAPEGMYKL